MPLFSAVDASPLLRLWSQ